MVNLINVRTEYNFLDSLIKIKNYIKLGVENKLDVLFYSDVNFLYGADTFTDECIKNNIKPVIGASFKIFNSEIILYAKSKTGYEFISIVSSKMALKKEVQFVDVINNLILKDLIIVFCPSVKAELEKFNSLKLENCEVFFGVNKQNYEILKNKENVIFANPIKYFNKNDKFSFEILKSIENNYSKLNVEDDFHYFTDEEVKKYIDLKKHNNAIKTIISKTNFNLLENKEKHFLKINDKNSLDILKKVCKTLIEKYCDINKLNLNKYLERLDYEITIIDQMNFVDYFLIVQDFIKYAKEQKILVGPGRGSAAGSLVSFCLGITWLDPIKYNLMFERFLNTKRYTMPDIDIDFQDDRREEIINYLSKKYKDKFATISTFQTIGIKNAIRDCGKVLKISETEITAIIKSIKTATVTDLELAFNESERFKAYENDSRYTTLFQVIKNIIGLPRQAGTHAAGVVFSDIELSKIIPTKLSSQNIQQTQFPMTNLENLGLIKTDILGLRNLTVLKNIINLYTEQYNKKINLRSINLNDKKTFDLLCSAKTLGIFQFESEGMRKTLLEIKPRNLEEISSVSALYRPGPQENIPLYVKNKLSKKFKNIDKRLDHILNPTYGIIVFQEQIMQIFSELANFSLNEADIIRRAISKKSFALLDKYKKEFFQNLQKNNFELFKAQKLWDFIYSFANYGFNKAHAMSYALISYWFAYFKANYPQEFYCGQLNSLIRNIDKSEQFVNEIKNQNMQIVSPSIKTPTKLFVIKRNKIQSPLSIVKGVSEDKINQIVSVYEKDKNAFQSFESVITILQSENILDEETFSALVYSGTFDEFGYSRKFLMKNMEDILYLASLGNLKENTLLEDHEKDDTIAKMNYEREYIGFFISENPLIHLRNKEEQLNKIKISKIKDCETNNIEYNVLGTLKRSAFKLDKNHKEMAFIDFEDETEKISLTIFTSVYTEIKDQLVENGVYLLSFKKQVYKDQKSGVVTKIIKRLKD
ncbi:DNA polymerase III subunit alpha [Spiroplasma endosymbiont of Crioceris asparagi]|uniref:DNA polymerase III subunit alpha n=1 Tax=Spiroplasma endosymbiont of Crioceris asparagi TaxID=3066286 RepID=UPI0030D415DF